MPDSKDGFSEKQDTPPTDSSNDPLPSANTSTEPASKRSHRTKKRHRNQRKGRNKRKGSTTHKKAQEMKGGTGASRLEPDLEEVTLQVDDKEWTVRVIGRSQTQTAALLMLGFWMSPEDAGAPDRETLISGRVLSELNLDQLQSAYKQSKPPRTDQSRDFFSDIPNRGRN